MAALTLAPADRIADAALAAGDEHGFAPLCVVVLRHRRAPTRGEARRAVVDQPGRDRDRQGAPLFGHRFGGRQLARRADAVPKFFTALATVLPKGIVPVLVRDREGLLLGAVGISGDTSDNDETVRSPASPPSGCLPTRQGSRDDRMPR